MALPVWGSFASRNKCLYNLISFDTHLDTHPPFSAYLCQKNVNREFGKLALKIKEINELLNNYKYQTNNFDFEDVYKLSCSFVKNDEQIQTAYAFDYIKSYTIIHRNDAQGYEDVDRENGIDAKYIAAETISKFNFNNIDLPIALDFDLDYFRNEKDYNDAIFNRIANLIKDSSFITIACEPNYFNECKDNDDFDNDKALSLLICKIKKILTES